MQWVTSRRVSRSHGDPYRVRLMVALPLSEQLAHLLERCPKLPGGASGGADELPDGLWDHPCVWLMCCCCYCSVVAVAVATQKKLYELNTN